MDNLQLLVEYFFNQFLFVFIVCLLGSFVRDCTDTIKNLSSINLKKVFISTLFCSIGLTALFDYISFKFSLTILICFFSGMWSYKLLEAATNWFVVKTFLKHFLGRVKSDVGNAVSDTLNEIDSNKDKEDK